MNAAWFAVGQPWMLLGLALCPVLAAAAWRGRVEASRRRRFIAVALRAAAAAMLVLAVADLRVRWSTRSLAVAVAGDASASVSAVEAAALRASVPRHETGDVQWLDVTPSTAQGRTRETDLARSLDTAVAVLPTERVRRVVLATDGRETHGDVLAAADAARRAGVEVDVLPIGDHPPIDGVAVVGLEAPRWVRAGREQGVGVRLLASRAVRATVTLRRDGAMVGRRTIDVPEGSSVHDFSVAFPDEGVRALDVAVQPDGEPGVVENDHWRGLVRVVTPPRVLLVRTPSSSPAALADVFRGAHLAVDEVAPEAVPDAVAGMDRYQFAALDELVLTSLDEQQQRALRTWVEERGGGLLTTTGMHGVGRAPELLRDIEPIEPPRAIPEPRPIELILVIDRSGSMMGPSIVNARNAGIAAVHALRPDSRVGVVAFSNAADVTVAPVPMARSEEVTRAIAGIHASGGTDLAAALNAAAAMVSSDPRYLHHVILMSDGESHPVPALAAATALRNSGATITAITLGPRVSLMGEIARIGRGRYHVTRSSTSLPELFVHEAQFRAPPPAREVAFRPSVTGRMGFLDGVDPAADPPLYGFTVAQLRPGALQLLGTSDGGPLLAHWFAGAGQVATLTSATSGRWADAWRTSPGFARLFGQMAWEMLRAQDDEDLELHVERVPGRDDAARISVVAPTVTPSAAPLVTLSRGAEEGVRVDVHPAGPGVWSAVVGIGRGFVVDAHLRTSREPTVAAALDAPYPAELRAFGVDGASLEAIARAGGGCVLRSLADARADVHPVRVLREARTPLLATALLAYLLSILALRAPRRRNATTPLRRDP